MTDFPSFIDGEAQLFRALNLSAHAAAQELPEACRTLAQLRGYGWDIQVKGHFRTGSVTITLTNPKWR